MNIVISGRYNHMDHEMIMKLVAANAVKNKVTLKSEEHPLWYWIGSKEQFEIEFERIDDDD